MGGVVDPGGRFAYDLHQYLDADFSGRTADCSGAKRALAGIASVTAWLKTNHKRGFLGEFGAAKDPACLAAMKRLVKAVNAAPGQWIGWTYWAAGEWWPDDYVFTAQRTAKGERPQAKALAPLIGAKGKPAECAAPEEGG